MKKRTAEQFARLEQALLKKNDTREKQHHTSAWSRGVSAYAWELFDDLRENGEFPESIALLDKALLNGASDWAEYSWGGCSLIYNGDIAERLCCPSELKKTNNGARRPNSREEWLDTQARALYQAAARIRAAWREAQ